MFKIHGLPPSSYVRTTRMAAFEKGVDYELTPVELKSDAHKALHPYQKMPAFTGDGVQLYETSAIVRYLDKVGKGAALYPADAKAEAEVDQWISVLNCYAYRDLVGDYALSYIFPKGEDGKPDRARIDATVPKLERDLDLVEAAVGDGEHLVGDSLTAADLFWVTAVGTAVQFPEGEAALGARPGLQRFLKSMAARPSFQHAHDF